MREGERERGRGKWREDGEGEEVREGGKEEREGKRESNRERVGCDEEMEEVKDEGWGVE